MKIIFEIEYRALPEQRLFAVGDEGLCCAMVACDGGGLWRGELLVLAEDGPWSDMNYHYEVREGSDGCEVIARREANEPHRLDMGASIDVVYNRDSWIDEPMSRPLNSALFTKAVFRREEPSVVNVEANCSVVESRFVNILPSQVLAIVGVSKELGHWSAEDALIMNDAEYPLWRVALPLIKVHTEYKFVILDRKTHEVVAWECGDNRVFEPLQFGADLSRGCLSRYSVESPKFNLAPWRGRGVSIPIFSLRTDRSMGVGDFGDIRNMVDWAAAREMSVIQILPINDTTMGGTWEDSYPYNANSTIALHPQYLALREVAILKDEELRESFESRAREIDALPQIDYTAVSALKMEYLRAAFEQEFEQLRDETLYTEFYAANSWWLESYALFSVLRDRYSTPDFLAWGEDAIYSEELLNKYKSGDTLRDMEFYYFVQYHLHTQLLNATKYARSRGVALKGDIPIGISRTSADAWIYPDLFNLSSQAGAPPDPFSDLGQNWGFPTYNWARMAEDNFAWWRARFEKMAEYFDAYRIDHILGFFRIWEIPMESIHGLTGRFNPSLPLTREEISNFGFDLKEEHLCPDLRDEILGELLPNFDLQTLKEEYFTASKRFKSEYDSQRKIADRVADVKLRDALMLLHNEVLFIEDTEQSNRYHPRILGCDSLRYRYLTEGEQRAFDAIHDDFYYRRHNDFWRDSAMLKLPTLIGSTEMLVCGEDLGMIPDCVEEVMQREQILSLEIERMPKAMGVAFATPAAYPYLSVCTCSTHDMTTIRGWWREDRALTQRYYNEALGLSGVAPAECSGEIARLIIERHLASPAMLTILPWQDWMAADESLRNPDVDAERINVPANSRHYWRYRVHLTL